MRCAPPSICFPYDLEDPSYGSIDMRERQTHCIPTYLKDPFILVEKYFRRHQRKAHSSC